MLICRQRFVRASPPLSVRSIRRVCRKFPVGAPTVRRRTKAIPSLPQTADFVAAARRIIWFEPPEKSLADPIRLMSYALAHARRRDMRLLLDHVGEDGLPEALAKAAPGIIDPGSW